MISGLPINNLIEGHEVLIKLTQRFFPILVLKVFIVPHPLSGSFLTLRLKDAVLSPCFSAFVDAEVLFGSEAETEEFSGLGLLFLSAFEQSFKLNQGLFHLADCSGAVD